MTFYITKKLKFNIKAERERVIRVLWAIIIGLTVLALVLGVLVAVLSANESDTIKAEVGSVLCGMGTELPSPEDFLVNADDASRLVGEFVEDFPEIKRPGTYSAKVRFTDEQGNKTPIYTVKVTVISDTVPPEVEILSEVIYYVGEEKPNYSQSVAASDNCVGVIKFKYDDSGVNYEKEGKYSVKVMAIDSSGNKTVEKIVVRVVEVEEEQ